MQMELTNKVRKFIMAGNSTFTIKNDKTGKHYTFTVQKLADKKNERKRPIHFVQVLNGGKKCYIGTIFSYAKFVFGQKSSFAKNSIQTKAFDWIFRNAEQLPEGVHIYHEGSCGRCGRELTNPESIEAGFGPDCIKKV